MMMKLTPDTQAPALSLPLVGGETWSLADQTPDAFTMVIFYRGLHCPVCKMYLGKLEALHAAYKKAGFSVVAVSMDPEDRATQSKADWGMDTTPMAYGLDLEAAKSWGLWISEAFKEAESPMFCEPGTFWIRPDGRLYMADISNMPWARPDLEFLLPKAAFALDNNYPARGTFAG